jgi:hypothetical protein
MSIYREPARLAMIQLRKAAEEQPTKQVSVVNKGLLSPKKMVQSTAGDTRKSESARVLDIMNAVREAMSGEV